MTTIGKLEARGKLEEKEARTKDTSIAVTIWLTFTPT